MGFWPTAELHVFEKAENPGFKKSLGNIYKKCPTLTFRLVFIRLSLFLWRYFETY